jgi:hypothetical protein
MRKIRYSEGGKATALSFPPEPTTSTYKIRKGRRTTYIVPKGLPISISSDARECFVEREFSQKLQHFLLNYAYTIVTSKVLSGEI